VTRRGRRRARGADSGPRPLRESLEEALAELGPSTRRERPRAGSDSDPAPTTTRAPSPTTGGVPRAGFRPATISTVFARWEDLVGTAVARHATPLRLETGTLVVAVDHPAWATQVRILAPGILARIAEGSGEMLDRLEVVVRPETHP